MTGRLWIPGHPVPKGSWKCVAKHAPGHSAKLVPDERKDPDNWLGGFPGRFGLRVPKMPSKPLTDPVELTATFYIKAPKASRYDVPQGHNIGDLDKFVRGVGDGIQESGLIKDDAAIMRVVAEKRWTDGKEGAEIELRPYARPAAPGGPLPVSVQVGAALPAVIGSISKAEDLPRLLRAAADEIERNQNQ